MLLPIASALFGYERKHFHPSAKDASDLFTAIDCPYFGRRWLLRRDGQLMMCWLLGWLWDVHDPLSIASFLRVVIGRMADDRITLLRYRSPFPAGYNYQMYSSAFPGWVKIQV